MKKLILASTIFLNIFLLAFPNMIYCQSQDDFYTIRDQKNAYYDANPSLKTTPGSGYKDFIRWDMFWRPRVGSDKPSDSPGDMKQYGNVMRDFMQNKDVYNRSTPWAVKWQLIGPAPGTVAVAEEPFYGQVMGKITALYVDKLADPTGKTIYAGAESSGLWKTTDLGIHWVNVTDVIPLSCGIADVVGSPSVPNLIYIATGTNAAGIEQYGFGIYKTTDGGMTWVNIYDPGPNLTGMTRIFVNPQNGQEIYGLVTDMVIRSKNGGETWDTIFGNPLTPFHLTQDFTERKKILVDIEMKPGNSSTIYISSIGFPNWEPIPYRKWHQAEIWKTTNALATANSVQWIRLDSTNFSQPMVSTRFELSVSPIDPNCVYVVGKDTLPSVKVYKTSDNGSLWKMRYENNPQLMDDLRFEFAVSPTDTTIMYIGGGYASRLEATGNTYAKSDIKSGHVDTRAMILLNGSPIGSQGINDTIIFGNDGGVTFSSDGGRHNFNINGDGLCITQFYGLGGTNKYPHVLCAGSIDNGIFTDTTNFWIQTTGGGDAGNCLVHPKNPKTMFSNAWGSVGVNYGIMRTYDNWRHSASWDASNNFLGEPSYYNRPIQINEVHPDTMYAGFRHLFRTKNASAQGGILAQWDTISWSNVNHQIPGNAAISAFKLAPSSDSIVYVAFIEPAWGDTAPVKKLFKTNNQWAAQPVWQNLSDNPGLSCLRSFFITDIEISPVNSNKIWIALSGVPGSVYDRVMSSVDGGQTWQDYSNGLSRFPVHCIRYKNGSPDGLYIGTDVGVYYTDSTIYNSNGWVSFNRGLPNPIVQDIEINDSLNLIRIATFGRGIWEAGLNCSEGNTPITITSDTTWENGVSIDGDLIVESGVTFTVKGEIAFPPTSRLIVKRGATLVVDGGKLTNRCSQLWLGVEVWGNSALPQIPTTSHYQGMLIMKNRAVIENSRIGVTACRKDPDGNVMWDYTGGIIYASNTTFSNNFKAIELLSYRFLNLSTFTNCVFETTTTLPDVCTGKFMQLVSLYDVHNIRFIGCDFKNTTAFSVFSEGVTAMARGAGIYSIDAGFSVSEHCNQVPCPVSLMKPSTFDGLFYGVKAINTDLLKSISIVNSKFSSNYRGVYLSSTNLATITGNSFYLKYGYPIGPPSIDTLYSLYLDNSTGFIIQENRFSAQYMTGYRPHVGLIVNNSGDGPNEVYNNRFDTMQFGIVASNRNRIESGLTGLCLKCNDFFKTQYAASITVSDPNHIKDWGIATYQGDSLSVTGPAGNTFSLELINVIKDLKNEGTRFKYYHHFQPPIDIFRVRPDFTTNVAVRSVNQLPYSKQTCCPSKLNGGGSIIEIKDALADELDTITAKEAQLIALVDGGSTEALNNEILTSVPSEAVILRDQLLSKSPFLSDTTMQSAISNENVLPNEMIRDVLVANPQSATSDKVLDELNNRVVAMPDSMMAEILVGEEIVSAKEALETEIASHKNKRFESLYELMRIYKNDTINTSSHDSLIAFLQTQPDLPLKYMLAFEYLNTRDTNSLNNTLASIPSSYNLNSEQSRSFNDYLSYFSVMKNMIKLNKNVITLDSTSVTEIQRIYTNGNEPVKSYAQNILISRGNLAYHEPILLPDELKSAKEKKTYRTAKFVDESYMKVFPNPAQQYVIVEYNLRDKFNFNNEVILTVTNMKGNTILQKQLMKRQDQELIPTSAVFPGTYMCSIAINGKAIDARKFVVVQ